MRSRRRRLIELLVGVTYENLTTTKQVGWDDSVIMAWDDGTEMGWDDSA